MRVWAKAFLAGVMLSAPFAARACPAGGYAIQLSEPRFSGPDSTLIALAKDRDFALSDVSFPTLDGIAHMTVTTADGRKATYTLVNGFSLATTGNSVAVQIYGDPKHPTPDGVLMRGCITFLP